jgi:hypothetical protein
MVAAAEQEYHNMREQLDGFTTKVQATFEQGWTDLEAVTDVYWTLRRQSPSTAARSTPLGSASAGQMSR